MKDYIDEVQNEIKGPLKKIKIWAYYSLNHVIQYDENY